VADSRNLRSARFYKQTTTQHTEKAKGNKEARKRKEARRIQEKRNQKTVGNPDYGIDWLNIPFISLYIFHCGGAFKLIHCCCKWNSTYFQRQFDTKAQPRCRYYVLFHLWKEIYPDYKGKKKLTKKMFSAGLVTEHTRRGGKSSFTDFIPSPSILFSSEFCHCVIQRVVQVILSPAHIRWLSRKFWPNMCNSSFMLLTYLSDAGWAETHHTLSAHPAPPNPLGLREYIL